MPSYSRALSCVALALALGACSQSAPRKPDAAPKPVAPAMKPAATPTLPAAKPAATKPPSASSTNEDDWETF